MLERGKDRRKGQAVFYDAITDRRRPKYERRGTVPMEQPKPAAVRLYGERRRFAEAGME